ncbi:nucleotidyltransferase family protein [Lamprobacter modestohalophilus]|uniref:nucleotidyltransferase domain-containing protein n=1 Tax=Lamprobacter modestohalophilus TaxID=1064514 RepID=UPI002ADEC88C|nr:nucleotidyltransferase family protein [Lamprobacter modestohalophilus]MEA1050952.1 nucleotidyltransferase family protein [Lamprobacter modestohalophilus]
MPDRLRQSCQAGRLLLAALRCPADLPQWDLKEWDLLLRVARRTRLLARLEADLARHQSLDCIPERAAHHLCAARNVVSHRQTRLKWEVDRILWALQDLDVQIVALKGVAYMLAGLPTACGRFAVDVDLLVPQEQIPSVEQRLLERGWMREQLDPYDDQYYREWMHEIPALRHRERETEVDIHHRILPRTSRLQPDPALLFQQTRAVPGSPIRVLGPQDMILHALVHLFHEGDPKEGLRLRDLVDVADLLRHFGQEPGFWEALVPRAEQLQLGRPLYYGLVFSRQLLGTEIPDTVAQRAQSAAPSWLVQRAMGWIVPRAILPTHPDQSDPIAALARWAMYLRAHWLRMPPGLLFQHLARKTWRRVQTTLQPQGLGSTDKSSRS